MDCLDSLCQLNWLLKLDLGVQSFSVLVCTMSIMHQWRPHCVVSSLVVVHGWTGQHCPIVQLLHRCFSCCSGDHSCTQVSSRGQRGTWLIGGRLAVCCSDIPKQCRSDSVPRLVLNWASAAPHPCLPHHQVQLHHTPTTPSSTAKTLIIRVVIAAVMALLQPTTPSSTECITRSSSQRSGHI